MKKTTFKIREAVPADVPSIVKLVFELAIYEKAEDQCFATDKKMHEQLFGDRPTAECLVATVEDPDGRDQVVGIAIFFHNFSTWEAAPGLYLEDIYVRQTIRKQGIGMALIERLALIAKERNCVRFEWSCLDWNKPARDFYESFGAKHQDGWVIYRTEGNALNSLAEKAKNRLEEDRKSAAPAPPTGQASDGKLIDPAGNTVIVFTDGGSDPNPGVGAWACVMSHSGEILRFSGGELGTTNNRMEMSAAIEALARLKPGQKVKLMTDSQYLKNGITTWIKNWKKNNWVRGKGRDSSPVKNVDLWLKLDHLCTLHNVEWGWVRGHSGEALNEECDELCTATIAELKKNSTKAEREAALERLESDQKERERLALSGGQGEFV